MSEKKDYGADYDSAFDPNWPAGGLRVPTPRNLLHRPGSSTPPESVGQTMSDIVEIIKREVADEIDGSWVRHRLTAKILAALSERGYEIVRRDTRSATDTWKANVPREQIDKGIYNEPKQENPVVQNENLRTPEWRKAFGIFHERDDFEGR